MKFLSHNQLNLFLCFFSTFIFSVSIGINAIIIPQFMENSSAFNAFSISINLSLESFCAILLSIYSPQIVRFLGLRLSLFISAILRFIALVLLGIYSDVGSWFFLILLLGGGTFFYLFLLQSWINQIHIAKFKGVIYSVFGTLISLGIATGSAIHQYINYDLFHIVAFFSNNLPVDATHIVAFFNNGLIDLLAISPIVLGIKALPKVKLPKTNIPLLSIVKANKSILFAVALCGISFFGVSWYITIYGTRNGFDLTEASFLLGAFMMGSVCLDMPLTGLAEFINRKYMLVISALFCTLLAIFLPLAIYDVKVAYLLLFVWGGIISSMYSNCLYFIEERYDSKDSIAANAAFTFMENSGAALGLLLIGTFLPFIGTDGFSYVIILANIVYFSLVMIWYKVE